MTLQFRLTHKISAIGALGVAGLLLVGALYLIGSATQERFRVAAEAARSIFEKNNAILVNLLELRRAEKDYLLRKDETYIKRHAELSKSTLARLDDLKQLIAVAPDDLRQNLDAIHAGFGAYGKHFSSLTGARTALGLNENSGLEGKLRKSVHEIESELKTFDHPRLAVTMLMMRRHEKDFMLRGDTKYGGDMKKRAAEFADQLAASDLPTAAKSEIAKKLAAYQADFFAWMETAQQVAGHQKALSETFAAIEPRISAFAKAVEALRGEWEAAEANARAATALKLEMAICVIILCVAAFAFWVGRAVAKPLAAMNAAMKQLAEGNFAIVLPGLGRKDEVGEMAQSVETFKVKAEEKARREAATQAEQERAAAARRREDMHRLAKEFETAVGGIVANVSSAATELEAAAVTLTKTAEVTQQRASTVAAASDRASANVHAVATASEEMATSVNEIGRQVQDSTRIAGDAVEQARKTDERINALSQAANRIGDVVNLITSIAEQTNLLALNATIEAARAGEAGKGFAVVAQEVKQLAGQTAKATSEIGGQISGMQSATQESVGAIKEIGGTIGRISEIASAIAAAVEEQGAATAEISRNVQQAARGTTEVATNITDVNHGAAETGSASSQVLASARSLSNESSRLKVEMDRFLATVRAA